MSRTGSNGLFIVVWLLVIVISLATVTVVAINNYPLNHQSVSGKVTDLEDTVTSKGQHIMLVEVNNTDWYRVGDAWLAGEWRSRDTWGSLEEGKNYAFEVYGWRIGLLSAYPNIITVQAVTL